MTKEHELFLKNIKHIAKRIAEIETEDEMKDYVAMAWTWLTIRSIASKDELIDRTLPPLLEAIEEAYEWKLPTLDEIKQKALEQTRKKGKPMTKEHEVFLNNIKHIAKRIAEIETEDEMKDYVAMVWSWLGIRCVISKDELIDRTLPPLLEAIEEAYEWKIPTIDEIKQKAFEQTPPDEDER